MYNELFIKQETPNTNQTKLAFHMVTKKYSLLYVTSTEGVKWGSQINSISELWKAIAAL